MARADFVIDTFPFNDEDGRLDDGSCFATGYCVEIDIRGPSDTRDTAQIYEQNFTSPVEADEFARRLENVLAQIRADGWLRAADGD